MYQSWEELEKNCLCCEKCQLREGRTQVVFGVGFALLLPVFFGLDGVLCSMPVSDLLTFVIAVFIILQTYHKLNTEGAQRV